MPAENGSQDDLSLARRHAPIVCFDAREPFLPEMVGYRVARQPGPSPSFDRYLSLALPDGRRAATVIEYALWTDWDIQHLYELEHVWSYLDDAGQLIFAEASWHGRFGALVQGGRLSAEGERPVAYAQPGKHAMCAAPDLFAGFDAQRESVARATGPEAGSMGLLVGKPIAGRIEKTRRRDALVSAYLRRQAFVPTFNFSQRWDALAAPFLACEELIDRIPSRLEDWLSRLEAERVERHLWAVLFDLGDTLMIEETEEKDATATTQRAELFPGAAELIWRLRAAGYLVGLVADTRAGTYRNVLRQHGLEGAFDAFAISEELGCEKPDRRMFQHALDRLGLTVAESSRVAMVGNNLSRDVRGANLSGLLSIWLRHNVRYPISPSDDLEWPRFEATSCDQVDEVIRRIG
ncbi:MAG: HAD family hydrolase [Chloroflexota bacterium]